MRFKIQTIRWSFNFQSSEDHTSPVIGSLLQIRGVQTTAQGKKVPRPRHFQVPFELFWKLQLLNSFENPATLGIKNKIIKAESAFKMVWSDYRVVLCVFNRLNLLAELFWTNFCAHCSISMLWSVEEVIKLWSISVRSS